MSILLNPLAVVALVESTRRKTDARHCGNEPECVIVDRETAHAALLSCDCDCRECNAPLFRRDLTRYAEHIKNGAGWKDPSKGYGGAK